jgi:hypothetical protein
MGVVVICFSVVFPLLDRRAVVLFHSPLGPGSGVGADQRDELVMGHEGQARAGGLRAVERPEEDEDAAA